MPIIIFVTSDGLNAETSHDFMLGDRHNILKQKHEYLGWDKIHPHLRQQIQMLKHSPFFDYIIPFGMIFFIFVPIRNGRFNAY